MLNINMNPSIDKNKKIKPELASDWIFQSSTKKTTKLDKISDILGGLLLLTFFTLLVTITINTWNTDISGIYLSISIVFGFRIFLVMLEKTMKRIKEEF